jgi:hypothetical protein
VFPVVERDGLPPKTKEILMDVNPIELQKHLKGVNYPTSKDRLVSAAESNNAPQDVRDALQGMNDAEHTGPDDVMRELS